MLFNPSQERMICNHGSAQQSASSYSSYYQETQGCGEKENAVYQPATQAHAHEKKKKKKDDRRNESQQTLCNDNP